MTDEREPGSTASGATVEEETPLWGDWPADAFDWRDKRRMETDVPLAEALDSIALTTIDWDLMVWWNRDLASASYRLWQTPSLRLATVMGTMTVDPALIQQAGPRLPRSELRVVDHMERAAAHVLRSVAGRAGQPFRVYDPMTGTWRDEGEWASAGRPGETVMGVVDGMIRSFEQAMHRAVDLMRRCVDEVAPPLQSGASDEDKARREAFRKELLDPVNECHKMARSISRGVYRAIRSALRDRLAIDETQWDSEPRWLVLRDGVVDLDTVYKVGRVELQDFSPFHYSTMALDVAWRDAIRNAGTPEWQRGVEKVLPDEGVRRYLQKRYGAALLGRPQLVSKSMVWQYGPSDTAKSTLQECIAGERGVFAAYSIQASSKALTKVGQERGAGDLFIARARGRRFAIMSEITEGEMMDSEVLKQLTGGDTVTGTAKYANPVSYFFTATLFMASNHAPRMPAGDMAAATRIHVVPFEHRLWDRTKHPREYADATPDHRADTSWRERVLESSQERAAILRWVLEGLVLFGREHGLGDLPDAMKEKREEFLSDADPAARIVRTLLGEEPGWETRAWLRVHTDRDWKAAGFLDYQGVKRDRIDELIEARAKELGLADAFGTVKRNLVLAARNSLSDSGGALKRAAVPCSMERVYVMTRCTEVSVVSTE